ncbi:hypothetical protein JD844_030900, partial [Phrynosoma platyrhinos]
MASYFEEHGCPQEGEGEGEGEGEEPGPGRLSSQELLRLARSLFSGLEIDLGSLDSGDWDHRLPPPAAKKAVDALPAVRIAPAQADKGLKCPVCLLEFEEEETVREMPCQHLFHSGCLLPWLGKTNSCPLCRHELTTDNEEYEEYKKDKLRRQQQAHRLEYLHGAMYTYAMAVMNHHVCPVENCKCGTYPPESCLFSLIGNIGAFMVVMICFLRYGQLIEQSHSSWVNTTALITGCTNAAGLVMVGNFQ